MSFVLLVSAALMIVDVNNINWNIAVLFWMCRQTLRTQTMNWKLEPQEILKQLGLPRRWLFRSRRKKRLKKLIIQ